MNFEDLTDEQRAKAQACKTPEEMLALAKEEGYELSDEELCAISGGSWVCFNKSCDTYDVPPSPYWLDVPAPLGDDGTLQA